MSQKIKTPKKKGFLSDQIANLLTVKPRPDVEDDLVFGTKPRTVTRDDLEEEGSDHETRQLSAFRKQSTKLLEDISDRYAGKVSSRKELDEENQNGDSASDDQFSSDDASENEDPTAEEEEQDENDAEHSSDEADQTGDATASADEAELSADSEDESGEDMSDVEGSEEGFDLSQFSGKIDESEFKHMEKQDGSDEAKKGECVRNQLKLWEHLLETRISMQRCMLSANRIPDPPEVSRLREEGGESFHAAIGRTKGSAASLLTRLMELQTLLLGSFPETKDIVKNKKFEAKEVQEDPMDEEIESDSDVASEKSSVHEEESPVKKNRKRKLDDYSQDITDRHAVYSKYANTVIQKWNDKTRITAVNKNQGTTNSTLAQIQYILNDREKLIKRTQTKRSNYLRLCEREKVLDENDDNKPEQELCPEIFDDDDFYHQLLRELIEHKSAEVTDPVQLSRQWIALQQLRSKLKRKVDTRATKGRRIRYAVHSKLVNFMGPEPNLSWTDEAKDELYASLFGKNFENITSVNGAAEELKILEGN